MRLQMDDYSIGTSSRVEANNVLDDKAAMNQKESQSVGLVFIPGRTETRWRTSDKLLPASDSVVLVLVENATQAFIHEEPRNQTTVTPILNCSQIYGVSQCDYSSHYLGMHNNGIVWMTRPVKLSGRFWFLPHGRTSSSSQSGGHSLGRRMTYDGRTFIGFLRRTKQSETPRPGQRGRIIGCDHWWLITKEEDIDRINFCTIHRGKVNTI